MQVKDITVCSLVLAKNEPSQRFAQQRATLIQLVVVLRQLIDAGAYVEPTKPCRERPILLAIECLGEDLEGPCDNRKAILRARAAAGPCG